MPEPTDAIADELLLVRCQLGERDALSQLIDRFDNRLQAYLARTIGGTQDDIRQEIWLSVLRGLGRIERADRLDAWFFPPQLLKSKKAHLPVYRELHSRSQVVYSPGGW